MGSLSFSKVKATSLVDSYCKSCVLQKISLLMERCSAVKSVEAELNNREIFFDWLTIKCTSDLICFILEEKCSGLQLQRNFIANAFVCFCWGSFIVASKWCTVRGKMQPATVDDSGVQWEMMSTVAYEAVWRRLPLLLLSSTMAVIH